MCNLSVIDIPAALLMAAFSIWLLYEYLRTFLRKKEYPEVMDAVRLGLFFLWQVAAILDIVRIPDYLVLGITCSLILFVSYSYQSSIFQRGVFVLMYSFLGLLMELLAGSFFILARDVDMPGNLFGSLVSKIMLLMIIKVIQVRFLDERMRELPRQYNVVLLLIPLGSMVVVYGCFVMGIQTSQNGYIIYSIVIFAIMLFINALVFAAYRKISQDMELQKENEVYRQQIDLYSRHIRDKENSMSEFRKARHALKNQLLCALGLCQGNAWEELGRFLEGLIDKEPFDPLILARTDNPAVDAIINYKYAIAQKNGIHFDARLNIPAELPFKNSDLCIILGDALDNALEAIMRSRRTESYIKVFMKMDGKNLAIGIENPYDGDIRQSADGKIQTTKEDTVNHGFGLEAIYKAVDRCHGQVIVKNEDNKFTLKVILYSK